MTGWIKGFGPEVEVLEPEELRSEIIADLKKNLSAQKPPGSSLEL
ncbi:MAG: WYL domain-containing protein [Deltaproteobacteria bacterium]|nr:WYL domain-containing protein [Deltaproteobacteria bacterium]